MEEFNNLLDFFQRRKGKSSCNHNLMDENILMALLIVMDDVWGLDDKSENFAIFLTVSRKFGFTCVYIFHTIYPTRNNWQIILSQTKIFIIFPGSIQASSVVKMLLLTVAGTLMSIYRTRTFVLTGYILTYLIPTKNSA